LKNVPFASDARQNFESLIDLRARVLAGHDGADARFAFGDGGEGDSGGHETGVEESFAELHCLAAIADDDGRDGGFAFWGSVAAHIEARVGELLLEVFGV